MRLEKGFTLVELIIVIAILFVLTGIAIPRIMNANYEARGSKLLADMNSCESAINIYYAKNAHFPESKDEIIGSYMVVWPNAQSGKAIITKHDGFKLDLNLQIVEYKYIIQENVTDLNMRIGRVTVGGYTVEDLLNSSESSLILNDE